MTQDKLDGNAAPKFLRKDADGAGVTFTLGNGQSLRVELANLPESVKADALLHGLSQKIGDAAAGCSADKAYGAAFAAMSAVVGNLREGRWNAVRESGGKSDLIAALAKLKKVDVEAVAAVVGRADEATIKAWLKNPKVDAEIREMRLKRAKEAAKSVNVDDIDLGL